MIHFSFIILHYQNFKDTVECIESLLKIEYQNYKIIIVDNGSPNQSGKELIKQYRGNLLIKVLISEKNLGFAKGNNIGYMYAKNELKSEFIFLLNNDTIIKQKTIVDKIIRRYNQKHFHVLGPDITTLTGIHQNPATPTLQNLRTLKNQIRHHSILLMLAYFNCDILFQSIKKYFFPKPFIPLPQMPKYDPGKYQEDIKLHGSALCFSKKYIEKYDGLYPKTYMYSEESILFYICKRDNLKTIYSPEIKVIHKEDGATDMVLRSNRKKRIFYFKNFIKSGKELKKLMINDK